WPGRASARRPALRSGYRPPSLLAFAAGALRRLARRVKAANALRRGQVPATRGCFPPPGLPAWQRGESALTLEPERTQHREYGVVKAHLVKAAVVAAGLGLAGSALAQDDLRFVVVSHGQAA